MKEQTITILGATGSIGQSTLDVIALNPENIKIFALTAYTNTEKLLTLCLQFKPQYAVVKDADSALWLEEQLAFHHLQSILVLYGEKALIQVAADPEVTTVVSAIVGAVGAYPTFAAANAGKKILLANKETLVLAGELFNRQANLHQAEILPIDSEHNAIFQVLPENRKLLKNIIITASGGPFLRKSREELENVSVEEALHHPNWQMGKKISIDSATMVNKGLEIIEAFWLFKVDPSQIEVIIHPESIVHSMVRLKDESVIAQLGVADMKIPISYALAYPERINSGVTKLDFTKIFQLSFIPVDIKKYPAVNLAYEVLHEKKDAGCIFNAANEVAVELFLNQQIRYLDIVNLISEVLQVSPLAEYRDLTTIMAKDQEIRAITREKALRFKI